CLQDASVGDMDDQRIAEGASLCCEDALYGLWLQCVSSQAVDCFCWKDNKLALLDEFGCILDNRHLRVKWVNSYNFCWYLMHMLSSFLYYHLGHGKTPAIEAWV